MSWQDDIQNIPFTIITGDGKQWQPKFKPTGKNVEYNASSFEFINVSGTLTLRQEPKGIKHDFEFYFDGENAIIDGNNFEISARNKKYWTVSHPFYGNFLCQPLTLSLDNSQLNCSKFTVSVIETITDIYPIELPIIEDKVRELAILSNEAQEIVFAESGEIDNNALIENINMFDRIYSKIIGSDSELLEFKTLVSNALIEFESDVSTHLSIIRATIAVINYPATVIQSVESRINALEESLTLLHESLTGSREGKFRYEVLGGAIIGASLVATSSNITDDYEIRTDVLAIQAKISEMYGTLLTNLDALQTDRADSEDSYIPSFSSMNSLNEAVNYTVNNLFNLAFEAKQEREFLVDYDTNLILLTHRFYGLDKEDQNIDKFIKTNNIGLNEMLCIQKGRKIIYYV